MTDDERKARLLRERARKLADRDEDVAPRRVRSRVVVVESGRESYGLPVASVREIVKASPIAPMPGLPAHVPGVAAVRGELVSVVDLGELVGHGRTGTGAFFAVVESPRGTLALRVETVVGIRDVHEDEIAEALGEDSRPDAFVAAYTRDFVGLVDVTSLLADERLVVGHVALGEIRAKARAS